MRVAVLGTGIMGAPMARNIAAAGHDVVVWNRTRDEGGGDRAAGGGDTGRGGRAAPRFSSRCSATSTRFARRSTGVDLGGIAWMQSSTVGERVTELAELGARLVDAPVVGTKKPAEDGTLTALLAGDPDDRDAVRPIAEAVAAKRGRRRRRGRRRDAAEADPEHVGLVRDGVDGRGARARRGGRDRAARASSARWRAGRSTAPTCS